MIATKKGWDQSLMIGYHAKETAYNTAMTVNATNFSGVKGHSDYDPDWADDAQTNKEEVTGTEHGTDITIVTQGFNVNIAQPKAKPNFVIGMMAAAFGSITSAQDPGKTAYSHHCEPVAVGTALPSFNLIGLKGGLQYLHTGCMVDQVVLTMEENKPVSCEAKIMGSGYRATNADSFIDEPSESWMLPKNGYIWLEQDANISIAASPAQGAEQISSATPDDLKARIKTAKYTRNNALQGQFGYGAGNDGYFQGLDYSKRSNELALTLLHSDATDLGYYTAGTILCVQLEIKGALIAAGGTMYFGYSLRIPRFKLKKAPLPKGGVNDSLTVEYDGDVQNDGTNSDVIFWGYNAKSAFFA